MMFLLKASDFFKAFAAFITFLAPYIMEWIQNVNNPLPPPIAKADRAIVISHVQELLKHLA